MDERLRSHYESLVRVIGFTRTADNKAAPVLALQVALLGALATRSETLYAIIANGPWNAERVITIVLAAVYGLLLTAVIGLASLVYVPMNARTDRSLIFFEDIAAIEFEAFESAAQDMTLDLIERQLLDQIYRVSVVASIKMRRVRYAIILSLPTIPAWFALLAI